MQRAGRGPACGGMAVCVHAACARGFLISLEVTASRCRQAFSSTVQCHSFIHLFVHHPRSYILINLGHHLTAAGRHQQVRRDRGRGWGRGWGKAPCGCTHAAARGQRASGCRLMPGVLPQPARFPAAVRAAAARLDSPLLSTFLCLAPLPAAAGAAAGSRLAAPQAGGGGHDSGRRRLPAVRCCCCCR